MIKLLSEFSIIILSINVFFAYMITSKRSDLKWFEICLVFALLIQVQARLIGKVYGNNLPLLHLYTAFEFVFLSLFYRDILWQEGRARKILTYLIVIILLLIVANSYFLQPVTGFNTNAKGLTQVIVIFYAVAYFFKKTVTEIDTGDHILNRINAAILIYYAGSFFIFIFAEFLLVNSKAVNSWFWDVNAGLYLIFQILILFFTRKLIFMQVKKWHKL